MKEHAFFRTISWDKLAAKDITPPFRPKLGGSEGRDALAAESPPALMTSQEKEALVFDQFTYNENVLK